MSQTENGATATLVVNPSNVDSFQNKGLYCTNIGTNFFYLFISSASEYILRMYAYAKEPVEYYIHRYLCSRHASADVNESVYLLYGLYCTFPLVYNVISFGIAMYFCV